MSVFLVGLGGALGSVLRYGVGLALSAPGFPWGTLGVNILGSGIIGVLAGLGISGNVRLFLVTGVLGGFTTFSAFSLETGLLWERSPWLGGGYVLASVGLGLLAFFLAWQAVRGG